MENCEFCKMEFGPNEVRLPHKGILLHPWCRADYDAHILQDILKLIRRRRVEENDPDIGWGIEQHILRLLG